METKKDVSSETPFVVGRASEPKTEEKNVLNYIFFLSHREEILAMKEQVHLLRMMMKAA